MIHLEDMSCFGGDNVFIQKIDKAKAIETTKEYCESYGLDFEKLSHMNVRGQWSPKLGERILFTVQTNAKCGEETIPPIVLMVDEKYNVITTDETEKYI